MEDLMNVIKQINFSLYGSKTANKIQEEILNTEDMLNATKKIVEKSMLQKLFDIIHIEAYNEAMKVGYDDGFNDGYKVGYEDGYSA